MIGTSSIYTQNIFSLGGKLSATFIIFLINPLIGLLFSLLLALQAEDDYEDNRPELMLFLITAAAWISLINITKTISGDQGTYTRVFLQIPINGFYKTIFNAWGGSGKEPAFSFLTWILYWITGGSVRLYYFILSYLIYFPHFLATYVLFKKVNLPKGSLICGVLVLTFFTQYFVMTLQIIRQMLAAGIVIYAIVYRTVYGKNNWILLGLSVLIHTSAAFLVGLSLVPWFYSELSKKRALIILACFIPFIVFNSTLGIILGGKSGVNAIDYGLSMYGNTGYTDGSTGMNLTIMMIVFIPLIIAGIITLIRLNHNADEEYEETEDYDERSIDSTCNPLYAIVYISILLMIFVLSFTKSPLIQYRFFYYSYSFIPLLIPLIIIRPPFNKMYWSLSSIFFIVRFFVIHNTSVWKYLSVGDMLTSTIYYYWTGNFHWMYLL